MPLEVLTLAGMVAPLRDAALKEAEAIFWATSNTKTFASEAEREAFRQRWFARYAADYPEAFFIARQGGAVVGYLAGCLDTFGERVSAIVSDLSYYKTPPLRRIAEAYPAHLHINVAPGLQGKGIGRALMAVLDAAVRAEGGQGIHVVTGAASPAVKFYEACGYVRLDVPEWPGAAILVKDLSRA